MYAGTQSGLWWIQDGQAAQMSDIVVTDIETIVGNPPIYLAGTNKGTFVWWEGGATNVEEFSFDAQGAEVSFITSLLADPMYPDRLYAGTPERCLSRQCPGLDKRKAIRRGKRYDS